MKDFSLGISGFQFSDLYRPERLKDLHREFWRQAEHASPGIRDRFQKTSTPELKPPEESEILIETSKLLGDFLGRLFHVTTHAAKFKAQAEHLFPVYRFKREFLNVRVFPRLGEPAVPHAAFQDLDSRVKAVLRHEPAAPGEDPEAVFSRIVLFLYDCQKRAKKEGVSPVDSQRAQYFCSHIHGTSLVDKLTVVLKQFEDWCVQIYVDPERRKDIANWISYTRPHKLDFDHLVPVESLSADQPDVLVTPPALHRARVGFKLTDPRMTQKQVLRETDYCIYCHQREKDSCSKGFHDKTGYKKNPLGIELTGCPLDERISEMNWLKNKGLSLAALAMVMLDNPMCPGTGHRICNDCMKGCIFQKQEPVNIPQNETGVLTDVLNMPLGVEIYSLLTRFNPLNKKRPYALPFNGHNVLVVGMGPAGYTLAHYLANEGFGVIGIDGLKIEPLDGTITGQGRAYPKPIQNFSEIRKELDERVLGGFGGVSEYGITVRWDKNFLTLIHLTLARRQNVRIFGGVRFGGTIELQDAWDLGFDHVAIAAGAGKPTIVPMKNNLAKGTRKASDFLMSLQLTGAFKKSSLSNLQVRLPAVIIGGGLTAFDTATELLAYYPVLVEKVLDRFEALARDMGEEAVFKLCNFEEQDVLREYLSHGRAVREEKQAADRQKRIPDFARLCREWGGVTVAYRKRLQDSPAYRLNHEEVIKAMEEGVAFRGQATPVEIELDEFGSTKGLVCDGPNGERFTLTAKSVSVAAGTSPNVIYEKENPSTFELDGRGRFFKKHQAVKDSAGTFKLEAVEGKGSRAFFTSFQHEGKFVSFYGDNHPDYAGNVVKAMASAKDGAPKVFELFADGIAKAEKGGAPTDKWERLVNEMQEALTPKVARVNRLAPNIVEVIVKSKYATRKFKPGQFYRLQNFETNSHSIDGNRLCMEGLALTGAWTDPEKDLLSMVVLEMGTSSRLCALLKPGETVVTMGPTGAPSEIASGETVLLVGGGLGNAVLMSIAQAMRQAGSRVIYFAGYRRPEDLFFQSRIEQVTDQMIWSVDKGSPIATHRPQDLSFVGNIVESMHAYASGQLQSPPMFPFQSVDRVLAIGSDRMMRAVKDARFSVLAPFMKSHVAIGSINSPMQCMMKEVCAQCLQRQVDPSTGRETFVFSCFNQDQPLDSVDFDFLKDRLSMNSLLEKLSDKHLELLLSRAKVDRI